MDEMKIQVPLKERVKKYYERYMLAMGVLGQSLFFIQGIKIFVNRSAQDVSLVGFLFGLVSVTSWLIYGIMIKNRVLIIANLCAVIGALTVVMGILIHG